jgi:hypothetical protein
VTDGVQIMYVSVRTGEIVLNTDQHNFHDQGAHDHDQFKRNNRGIDDDRDLNPDLDALRQNSLRQIMMRHTMIEEGAGWRRSRRGGA